MNYLYFNKCQITYTFYFHHSTQPYQTGAYERLINVVLSFLQTPVICVTMISYPAKYLLYCVLFICFQSIHFIAFFIRLFPQLFKNPHFFLIIWICRYISLWLPISSNFQHTALTLQLLYCYRLMKKTLFNIIIGCTCISHLSNSKQIIYSCCTC